jgi:hypothetical protein
LFGPPRRLALLPAQLHEVAPQMAISGECPSVASQARYLCFDLFVKIIHRRSPDLLTIEA